MEFRDSPRRVTAEAAFVYRHQVLSAVPRLLGTLNRDPLSPAAGSFDRDHWAWKFRDSPVMTLQMAIAPLASLWVQDWPGNPWSGNSRLLSWIELAIGETLRRQGRHGGFETIGPNTWDHGVTLAMVSALASAVESLGPALDAGLRDRALEGMRRGCDFASRTSEDYAFISNHQALFALAHYRAYRLLGDEQLRVAGDACIGAIIRHQSGDGWYREYGGPDAGYETLGLSYLAQCWRLTHDASLLDSVRRSIGFLAHCVYPDGSLGGFTGSRHTALYYPGGLETFAEEVPVAAGIAGYLRERLQARNVVTLDTTDAENAPTLLTSYLDAAEACASQAAAPRAEPLPHDALDGMARFAEAGITFSGTPHYYAITNAAKGGVIRVFGRRRAALAYEDAGYVIDEGGTRWASQVLGCGHDVPGEHREVRSLSQFALVRQVQLTPGAFVILRLLNLTLFRSLVLGGFLRRLIIGRLVTGKTISDRFSLARSVRFLHDRIVIRDELTARVPGRIAKVRRPRSFTAIHMGSANYFTSNESAETPGAAIDRLEASLRATGRGVSAFEVVFSADGSATIDTGGDATDRLP